MKEEKIKARLPKTVYVMHHLSKKHVNDWYKNKASISHDGEPVGVELKQCGMSLDWYLKDADLLFKSGADAVELRFKDIPSGGIQGYLIAAYSKIPDTATNTRFGPQRNITYTTQQCTAGLEIEVDAKLVEAYRRKVAHELDFKKRDTTFH